MPRKKDSDGGSVITRSPNRWWIALAGTLLQVCLGTVYAWSYFQKPMVEALGCRQSTAAWAFSLAICFLGLAAAWGGKQLPRLGPRRLAVLGGILYGLGYLVAAPAIHYRNLPLLYLGFGVLGGIGLGLGYVTPVATVAKWFPDKKGLATGLVVMGFGLGALVMSKVLAPALMSHYRGNLVPVFLVMGLILLATAPLMGAFMRNPPVAGAAGGAVMAEAKEITAQAPWFGGRFIGLWLVFFCNIVAGIVFLGFQSPMLQDLLRQRRPAMGAAELAAAGATLIGISSLCNGLGRLFWGGISDRLGRARTFRLLLGTQIPAFLAMIWIADPWWFGVLVCYVLLCYGGGFGCMPSLVLQIYGSRRMPAVYGAMLTAWSAAGIVGPQVAALARDSMGSQAPGFIFTLNAILLAVSLVAALFLSDTALTGQSA
jgi:OFA family oxalate/formate antiporter-like MFS transporter